MKYLGRVEKGDLEAEGKTKKVFNNTFSPGTVIIEFKPDITAGDGEKREKIAGKAEIDCATNNNFFLLLNARKIPTHYRRKLSGTEFLAKKLIRRIPAETVTRRVGYGSLLERTDFEAGHHFKNLYTEFFYKDDFLNDPRLDDKFIEVKDKKGYFAAMRRINEQAFIIAEEVLRKLGYQLIDWKLEYGFALTDKELTAEMLIIIDEITAGNIRVWPIKVKKLDLSADNLLNQLNPDGMLDKELFRQGKDLRTVKSSFEALMELTNQFHKFY